MWIVVFFVFNKNHIEPKCFIEQTWTNLDEDGSGLHHQPSGSGIEGGDDKGAGRRDGGSGEDGVAEGGVGVMGGVGDTRDDGHPVEAEDDNLPTDLQVKSIQQNCIFILLLQPL